MTRCTECQTVEGDVRGALDEQGNEAEMCMDCGAYDSIEHYDEDAAEER